MRALLVAAALITLDCSTALAGPQEEALQVAEKWAKTFTESDVDGIVKLYAPDALFFGTSSKALATKPEEIRKYFERALSRGGRVERKLDPSVVVLSDTVVVVTGLETVTGVRGEKPFSATGRVTYVVAKRGSAWQIAHFHRSAMPQ
jgi:uncharacterized protein (TIGR02246 family)